MSVLLRKTMAYLKIIIKEWEMESWYFGKLIWKNPRIWSESFSYSVFLWRNLVPLFTNSLIFFNPYWTMPLFGSIGSICSTSCFQGVPKKNISSIWVNVSWVFKALLWKCFFKAVSSSWVNFVFGFYFSAYFQNVEKES